MFLQMELAPSLTHSALVSCLRKIFSLSDSLALSIFYSDSKMVRRAKSLCSNYLCCSCECIFFNCALRQEIGPSSALDDLAGKHIRVLTRSQSPEAVPPPSDAAALAFQTNTSQSSTITSATVDPFVPPRDPLSVSPPRDPVSVSPPRDPVSVSPLLICTEL